MQCLSCNKTISQKDRFCRRCGAIVTPDRGSQRQVKEN